MAKEKKKVKAVVKDGNGEVVATIEPRYKTLPVDLPTYRGVLMLCDLRGLNKRSQGIVTRNLVAAELAKHGIDIKTL